MTEAAAPLLWSSQQQTWLQALGHTVYLEGGALTAAFAPADVVPEPPAARVPARPAPRSAAPAAPEFAPAPAPSAAPVAARKAAPVATAPQVDVAPARPARVSRRVPVVRMPDPLQLALLRISGCDPSLPETQALMESWPVAQMRRDPAIKRALWPQLRALRKRQRL